MPVDKFIEDAAALFKERNTVYGSNWERFGKVLKELLPSGMKLETEKDFARASTLFHVVNKLTRYCINFEKGGHKDSAIDSIVYWAILQELDNVENGKRGEGSGEHPEDSGAEDERKEERRQLDSSYERRGNTINSPPEQDHSTIGKGRQRLKDRRKEDKGRKARGFISSVRGGRIGEDRRTGNNCKGKRWENTQRWSRTANNDRRSKNGLSEDRAPRPNAGNGHRNDGTTK